MKSTTKSLNLIRTAIVVIGVAGLAARADAAACPHNNGTTATSYYASVMAFSPGTLTTLFVQTTGPNVCNATLSGAANNCFQTWNAGMVVVFKAFWANAAARTGTGAGGCSFMCPGGDCFVDANGLPVELLSFGVE